MQSVRALRVPGRFRSNKEGCEHMARKPNYRFEKVERERKKAAKRAAKEERRQKRDEQASEGTSSEAEQPQMGE